MKKSLSTRLMYSFMVLVAIIIAGITIGMSYLITDYFFKEKEAELSDKGKEVAIIVNYFLNREADLFSLNRYLSSADRLMGARILLFDNAYNLRAASHVNGFFSESSGEYNQSDRMHQYAIDRQKANIAELENLNKLSVRMKKSDDFSKKIALMLKEVYKGKRVKSHLFHPYYEKQVLFVGVPLVNRNGTVSGAMLLASPMSGLDKFLKEIYLYTFIIGFIALLTSLVIVRHLSKRMIKPLISMKDSASAIAAGDYSRKIEINGEDEIAELGNSLNSLSADVSEYLKKTEKMEKLRRDFVANVSHELRTPITIIRGYNEALSDGMVKDRNLISKYRKLINNETIRLEALVRELLDISKLQISEKFEFETEMLPLGDIVLGVADMLSVKSIKRNISLNISNIDRSLFVKGNGDRLFQLVMIFGDNAIKYTPNNGIVKFEVYKNEDGQAVFAVEDTGAGIPPEDIPYIWERFYKVDKSHCRNIPGTGLGLSIAKEIIRMHGATVDVRSEQNVGTRFEITFENNVN